MDLKDMREHIDQIDKELLKLFLERMEVSKQVAEYKVEHQLPVYRPEREQEILEKVYKEGGELGEYAAEFFCDILRISRERQAELIDKMSNELRKNLLCGLLGEGLSHSYSKEIHEAMKCRQYDLIEVSSDEIEDVLKVGTYQGLNVTIPYKKEVLLKCAHLSDEVKEIGSVNTMVKQSDGTYKGYNTDVYGFEYMVKKSGIQFQGAKVLVFGNGGASAAVVYAAKKLGASEIVVVSRKGPVTYQDLEQHYDAQVLINATPVGMYPNTQEQIVDLAPFVACEGVIDLIYNPARTLLLQQAEKLNLKYINGLPMLVAQAFRAEELFFDETMEQQLIDILTHKIAFDHTNLVLVGMPGSGKSAIGRSLGRRTGRKVVDLDREIEKKYNKSIPEIFEQEGEASFRKKETEVLREVSRERGIILVTGGGAVLSEENQQIMKLDGFVYHVERSVEQLAKRGRPLSAKDGMEGMYEKRLPYYRNCRDGVAYNQSGIDDAAKKIYKDFCKRHGVNRDR